MRPVDRRAAYSLLLSAPAGLLSLTAHTSASACSPSTPSLLRLPERSPAHLPALSLHTRIVPTGRASRPRQHSRPTFFMRSSPNAGDACLEPAAHRALRWECWLEGLPPRVFTISQPCCGPAPSSPRALAAVLGATSADGAKSRRCKPCASGLRSFLAPPLDLLRLLSRTGLVEDLGCHLAPLALVCRLLYAPPTRRAPPLVLG